MLAASTTHGVMLIATIPAANLAFCVSENPDASVVLKFRRENRGWTFRMFLHEVRLPGVKFLFWIIRRVRAYY
jgi:hypothetical protein